jgi:hypothetical protein
MIVGEAIFQERAISYKNVILEKKGRNNWTLVIPGRAPMTGLSAQQTANELDAWLQSMFPGANS